MNISEPLNKFIFWKTVYWSMQFWIKYYVSHQHYSLTSEKQFIHTTHTQEKKHMRNRLMKIASHIQWLWCSINITFQAHHTAIKQLIKTPIKAIKFKVNRYKMQVEFHFFCALNSIWNYVIELAYVLHDQNYLFISWNINWNIVCICV